MLRDEWQESATRIVTAIQPLLDERWADLVRVECFYVGEFFAAIDDALQGLTFAGKPLPAEIRGDVDAVLERLGPDHSDYERLSCWLSQLPPAQDA